MSAEYSFVAGDTGSILKVTCTDKDSGAVLDLSGCTVALLWKKPSDGTLVTKSMTINTPATAGIVQYQFAASELEAPRMAFEVKVTDGASKVIRSLTLLEENVRTALA